MPEKIKNSIKEFVEIAFSLTILGIVLKITGTTFFGVDFLPLILLIIIVFLIGLMLKDVKWIKRKI